MTESRDLLSLVIELRPATDVKEQLVPVWWGQAAHAFLLDAVRRADSTLSEALHDAQGPKPFTCSTLIGRFPGGRLDPAGAYTLRLTALTAPLAQIISGAVTPGSVLEFQRIPFVLTAVHAAPEAHPWAGSSSYGALAADRLAAGGPDRRISLSFTSPAAFRSQGRHVPLPLPDLVFGSLLERWNAFAPVAFPAEVKRYAGECLAISRYDLASRYVPGKQGALRMGGVGEITYTTLNYDRYWMNILHALADYAFYSGVGAQTAAGMGQCRRFVEDRPRRARSE